MSDALPPMPPTPDPGAGGPAPLAAPAGPVLDQPAPKRSRRIVAIVLAIALVVVAGGASAAVLAMRGSSEQLMSQVPAGADIVVTAYLDPAASQKLNLFRMAGRFPGMGSESDARGGLNELLDQVLAGSGLSHNDLDWVGSQVALEVNLPSGGVPSAAILLAADDVDAAERTLTTLRERDASATWHETKYKGVKVSSSDDVGGTAFGTTAAYAVVGDTVVFGSSTQAIDEVIDTDQGAASLQDSPDYQATMKDLPGARLLMVYVQTKAFVDAIGQQIPFGQVLPGAAYQTVGSGTLAAERGSGMTLAAEADGLALDFNTAYDSSKLPPDVQTRMNAPVTPNALTALVPASAYGVVLQQHVDDAMKVAIPQLEAAAPDVLAKLDAAGLTGTGGLLDSLTGDMAVELLPGSGAGIVNGAVVLGSTDGPKMQATLDKLRGLVTPAAAACPSDVIGCPYTPPPKWKTQDYKGTTISYLPQGPGSPEPAYAVIDGAGVLATSVASVEAIIDTKAAGSDITTSSSYNAAIAKVPSDVLLYVDVEGMLTALAADLPPDAGASIAAIKPVTTVVAGSEHDGSHQHFRLLIEIP